MTYGDVPAPLWLCVSASSTATAVVTTISITTTCAPLDKSQVTKCQGISQSCRVKPSHFNSFANTVALDVIYVTEEMVL